MPSERLCNLCGLRPASSREHLPGVGAANSGPVTIAYFRSDADSQHRRSDERVEDDGFVVRTLCSHCNSRTGGHYGTAYKDFVKQFSQSGILDAGADRTWVSLRGIQPLRVIKQMTSMFIAAQGTFPRDKWIDLCNFVLGRDRRLRTPRLRYYVYRNVGTVGRVTAFTSMMSIYRRWEPIFFCEIAWPPVGIVFCEGVHPLLARMKDITSWGVCSFRDRLDIAFSVPQLRVSTHWPLGFGTDREAHEWSSRDGVVALFGPSIGDDPTAQVSLLTRRPSRQRPNGR